MKNSELHLTAAEWWFCDLAIYPELESRWCYLNNLTTVDDEYRLFSNREEWGFPQSLFDLPEFKHRSFEEVELIHSWIHLILWAMYKSNGE